MLLQTGTVLVNAILAPLLITGWGTGLALGAFGAGLASSIANIGGLIVLVASCCRGCRPTLHADRAAWRPRVAVWLELMRVGLPAAGEFFLMFLMMADRSMSAYAASARRRRRGSASARG